MLSMANNSDIWLKSDIYVSPTEQQFDQLVQLTKEKLEKCHGETIIEVRF